MNLVCADPSVRLLAIAKAISLRFFRTRDDRHDAVQELVLKGLHVLGEYPEASNDLIARSMIRRAIDVKRSWARHGATFSLDRDRGSLKPLREQIEDPANLFAESDGRVVALSLIEAAPKHARPYLALLADGMPKAEAAESLGFSRNAAMRRQAGARKAWAKCGAASPREDVGAQS